MDFERHRENEMKGRFDLILASCSCRKTHDKVLELERILGTILPLFFQAVKLIVTECF